MEHKFTFSMNVYINPNKVCALRDGNETIAVLLGPGAIVLDPEPDKGPVELVNGQFVKYVKMEDM